MAHLFYKTLFVHTHLGLLRIISNFLPTLVKTSPELEQQRTSLRLPVGLEIAGDRFLINELEGMDTTNMTKTQVSAHAALLETLKRCTGLETRFPWHDQWCRLAGREVPVHYVAAWPTGGGVLHQS